MNGCRMSTLVEALHDARLGERDRAQVERHLTICSDCKALLADLERLRSGIRDSTVDPPTAPLDVARGRLRLLREAAVSQDAPSSRPGRRFVAPIAAVVALAMVATAVLFVGRSASDGRALHVRVLREAVDEGSHFTAFVDPRADAAFRRSDGDGVHTVELRTGAVMVTVRHLQPGERFLVKTIDGEVEVRGTRFLVEARDGDLVRVEVEEGVVEVRVGGATTTLLAHQRWTAPRTASIDAVSPSGSSDPPPSEPRPSASRRSGPPGPGSGSGPASSDFRDGMDQLEQGDFGAAASKLEKFAEEHRSDPQAEDALFLVAVSLSKAGRTDAAATAAKQYLAQYPNGYRRLEAERLLSHAASPSNP